VKPVARPATHHAVIALGLTQIIGWGTTFYVPAILAREIADSLDVPLIGILGAYSWALLISGLLARRVGALIDRHGAAPFLAGASTLAAAALLVHAAADGLWLVWLSWSIIGLGMRAMLYDGAFAALTALSGPAARRSISVLTLFGGLASTVFWPVSYVLLEAVGWRGTLILYALLNLLVCAPLHFFFSGCIPNPAITPRDALPPDRALPPFSHASASSARTSATRTPRERWAAVVITLLATALACHAFIWSSLAVHLPELLQGFGLGAGAAVTVASLMGPFQVLSRSAELFAQRWLSPLAIAVPVFAMLPLSLTALALPVSVTAAATSFVLIYGFSNGLLTILRGSLPLTLIGPRGYGEVLGRIAAPSLYVSALSPLLFGLAIESWGARVASLLLFLAGLAATAAAAALVRHARKEPAIPTAPET
jgi:hypothetical protein